MNFGKIGQCLLLALLCILLRSLDASSTSSTTDSRSEDRQYIQTPPISSFETTLNSEISKLIGIIEESIEEDSTYIYFSRDKLINSLKAKIPKKSSLFHFPDIDENTYNAFIKNLRKRAETSAEVKLHLWSLIVGIPIVGMKHRASYYDTCGHLLKGASKEDRTSLGIITGLQKLCVKAKVQNDETNDVHLHYDVSSDMLHSVILYRKKYLSMKSGDKECQKTLWDLFSSQLTSVVHHSNESEEKAAAESLIAFLLKENLRLTSRKPNITFGLVRLLSNTAIYVSRCIGKKSITLHSPCSREGVRFFGLQDGIFIVQSDSDEKALAILFGKQFFRRAFFTEYPCDCEGCADAVKSSYFPHYTFSMLPRNFRDEYSRTCEAGFDGEDDFAETFAEHILGNRTSSFVSHLLTCIGDQQLKTKLSDSSELKRKLFGTKFEIDLSELDTITFGSDDESDSVNELPLSSKFSLILEHFICKTYQIIRMINLSDSQLRDAQAKELGELLSKNVLPHLATLDISGNKISREGLLFFEQLLSRDSFKKLIARSNRFKSLPENFSRKISKKIVWDGIDEE